MNRKNFNYGVNTDVNSMFIACHMYTYKSFYNQAAVKNLEQSL